MYLGGNGNNVDNNFSLSDNELNKINTSSMATLYLGDYNTITSSISIIYIDSLNLLSSIANKVSFYANGLLGKIIVLSSSSSSFTNINIDLKSNTDIIMLYSSSLVLIGNNNYQLLLQSDLDCNSPNGSLILQSYSFISTNLGASIVYYGGDISFKNSTSYINSSSSTITISEQCSTTNSMLIGGTRNNNNYNLNLLQTELQSLYGNNLIFDSKEGSIFINSFTQNTHLSGISGGKISFIAATANTSSQYFTI